MPSTDRLQNVLAVGDIVNVPCVVTALTQTTRPTVTLTSKYEGFDAATDSIGTIDAIQVVKDR